MSGKINIALAVACVAALVTMSAVWFARGQTTNAPGGFQTPLVRDMELINDVRALTARVEALEAKVQDMDSKLQKIKQ